MIMIWSLICHNLLKLMKIVPIIQFLQQFANIKTLLWNYFLRLKRHENWTGGRKKFSSLVSTMPKDSSPILLPPPAQCPLQSIDIFSIILFHQSIDIFSMILFHRHFQRISIYCHQNPNPLWSLWKEVQAQGSPEWSTLCTLWWQRSFASLEMTPIALMSSSLPSQEQPRPILTGRPYTPSSVLSLAQPSSPCQRNNELPRDSSSGTWGVL